MFAFARDDGLPLSQMLAYVRQAFSHTPNFRRLTIIIQVRPGWDIPLNAVIVSFCITILLSMINIGSTTAFNAIASLGTASLISSYIVSITCVRIKRWRKEPLPHARWSLGKWGAPINDFSILYLIVVFVFTFFPMASEVTPETMNWNVLIYGFTIFFAIGYFFFKGRYTYVGPVTLVNKHM
jgi:choline transport protein